MGLGAFSISLDVQDLARSVAFYEQLGFAQTGGGELRETTDPAGTGPGHITLADPDGNAILIDQFRDRP